MSEHVKNDVEKLKLVWAGSEHKGIGWEVCKWGKSYQDKPCWNTYLYIHDKKMVDALWSNNVKNIVGEKFGNL